MTKRGGMWWPLLPIQVLGIVCGNPKLVVDLLFTLLIIHLLRLPINIVFAARNRRLRNLKELVVPPIYPSSR